jgi:hypothetical protein
LLGDNEGKEVLWGWYKKPLPSSNKYQLHWKTLKATTTGFVAYSNLRIEVFVQELKLQTQEMNWVLVDQAEKC